MSVTEDKIKVLAEMIQRLTIKIRLMDNTVLRRVCPSCKEVSYITRKQACPYCGEHRTTER